MRCNVLVYGATGYSGRLIAAEGKVTGMSNDKPSGDFRMILAARDGARLRQIAAENCMPFRRFQLDDTDEIKKHLDSIDVIINAAGPFAFTADRLAKAALEVGCHYVDITGEVDVYRQLDDFARDAAQRRVAIVAAAGYMAGASDILLDLALQKLERENLLPGDKELGAVRIALSSLSDFSRGSALTVARSIREQVIVVRKGPDAKGVDRMMVWHEPVGKLERTFDFGRPPRPEDKARRKVDDLQIASAANLIETLTSHSTVSRHYLSANTIESYMEVNDLMRIAYQAGATLASLCNLPWIHTLSRLQLRLLPEEPQPSITQERNVIVLEIEDAYQKPLINWRLETPDVYQFTAQVAVAVARSIVAANKVGWVTPADALDFKLQEPRSSGDERGFLLRAARPHGNGSGLALQESPVASALRDATLEMRPV